MANKGNTTFGFMLANHPNRFGFYPVMLRITRDRKTKRVKTELEVKKADWNQKAKGYKHFRDTFHNASVYNDMLLDILQKYKDTYIELKEDGNATAGNIIEKVKSGDISESFLQYAKDRTQAIYDAGGIRNWKKYNGFCNKLEAYLKSIRKSDLLFAELTPSFLSKFDAFLHKLPNERHPEQLLHQNTIAVVFNIFKTLVNRAITIDNKMKPEQNPFMKFKYGSLKTEKEKLDAVELDTIKALDLQEGSLIWHCRNYFFFSFYCAGIRAGDLIQLRWCNITQEGRLNYQMGKNHKVRDLKLVQPAIDILAYYKKEGAKPTDYIFPLLDDSEQWCKYITQEQKDVMPSDLKKRMFEVIGAKNALINKELAKIQKLAGLEKRLSFHISRHSFAKRAKDKGIDSGVVQGLLAHSSLQTTEKYMGQFDTSVEDAAMIKIFDTTEKEKLESFVDSLTPEQREALARMLANK